MISFRTTTDPKITRISHALGLSRRDATWLAAVADEVDVAAGEVLGDARFGFVALDGETAGRIVPPGVPTVVPSAASVLLLTADAVRGLAARQPVAVPARPNPRLATA